MLTARDLWKIGNNLLSNESSSTYLDSLLLICFVLNISKEDLWKNPERIITHEEKDRYLELIKKRKQHYPIAYLLKEKYFWKNIFYVDERVLIPRPDTEILVEVSFDLLKSNPNITNIYDIGTGSGAIGLSLALEVHQKKFHLLDINSQSLEVALINKKKLKAQANLQESDLLSIVDHIPHQSLIVSNLPYLTEEEVEQKELHYPYEPHLALLGGGIMGTSLINNLLDQILKKKKGQVFLILEMSSWQIPYIYRKMQQQPFYNIQIYCDLSGKERVIFAQTEKTCPLKFKKANSTKSLK